MKCMSGKVRMETREARCPGCRLGGELGATPKILARLAASAGEAVRLQLSATRPAWNHPGPATPTRSGLLGPDFLPTPRQRPQHSGSPSGLETASGRHPGRQHANSSATRRDEGEAKKEEEHFHGQEDQIWGGERTGKTAKI